MSNYFSLIIDVEKSKTYTVKLRNEIQNYINKYIEHLNYIFKKDMECSVTFSAGDELQGLFNNMTAAFLYYRLFEILVAPVRVRAGIGVGEWTVKMDGKSSTYQDGPAYHRARTAINEARKRKLQNIRICSAGDDVLANHLINASLPLKVQELYMQNVVHTMVEVIFPLVTENNRKRYSLEVVSKVLRDKIAYSSGFRKGKEAVSIKMENVLKLDKNGVGIGEQIFVNVVKSDVENEIIIRNMATIIADLLGCSRQNADSIIRKGNLNKIRELDLVALIYISAQYGR